MNLNTRCIERIELYKRLYDFKWVKVLNWIKSRLIENLLGFRRFSVVTLYTD